MILNLISYYSRPIRTVFVLLVKEYTKLIDIINLSFLVGTAKWYFIHWWMTKTNIRKEQHDLENTHFLAIHSDNLHSSTNIYRLGCLANGWGCRNQSPVINHQEKILIFAKKILGTTNIYTLLSHEIIL